MSTQLLTNCCRHLILCVLYIVRLSWSGKVTKGSDIKFGGCCSAAGSELLNRRQEAWVSCYLFFDAVFIFMGFEPATENIVFSARQHMLSKLYATPVRPSVRPSHGWISRKRLKLRSCNFHHTVVPSLFCLRYKFHSEITTGSPPLRAGASDNGGLYRQGNELI